MQYSTLFLSALAASSAMAAPQGRSSANKQVRVILSDLAETGSQTVFNEAPHVSGRPTQSGPFKTVEIAVGSGITNQALRCQVLDDKSQPIIGVRGAAVDITFGDAGKGAWTFRAPSLVSAIVCDDGFKSLGAAATEIRVVLANQAAELGSQTVFADSGARQQKPPVGSDGPFQTVELRLGPLVDPALRCQITDPAGKPITVVRGQAVATTFGDADKGEWTLQTQSEVDNIICDPAF